jgi:hypothetical protein
MELQEDSAMPSDVTGADPFANFNRDEKTGHFISTSKQVDKLKSIVQGLNQQMAQTNAAFQRQTKDILAASEALKRYKQDRAVLAERVNGLREMVQQQRELIRLQRESRRQSELSFGSMIRTTALIAAGWQALSKVREVADLRIHSAMIGGTSLVAQLKGWLANEADQKRALQLTSELFKSPTLRYMPRGQSVPAMAKLSGATTGLGQIGNQAIEAFVKDLDPAMKTAFMEAVNSKGVQAAVTQFRTAQNIPEADTLMSALEMSKQRGQGTLDPLIDSALKLNEAFERLDAAVIKVAEAFAPLVTKGAGWAANHPYLAGGGSLAATAIGWEGLKAGVRGIGGLGLRALGFGGAAATGGSAAAETAGGMAIPTITGFGAPGGVAAGAGATAAGGLTAGALLPWIAAGLVAGGTMMAGGAYIGSASVQPQLDAANAEAEKNRKRLENVAGANQQSQDEMRRLIGQRQAVTARLAQFEQEHRRSGFTQFFAELGGGGAYSEADQQTIESMRKEIANLQRQITPMYTGRAGYPQPEPGQKPPAPLDPEGDRMRAMRQAQEAALNAVNEAQASAGVQRALLDLSRLPTLTVDVAKLPPEVNQMNAGIQEQIQKLEDLRKTYDEKDATGRNAIRQIDTQIASLKGDQQKNIREQLAITAQDAALRTSNAQLAYEIARIGPLGVMGAGAELQDLQATIGKEMARLNEQLASIKGISDADLREQERIKGEMLKLNLQTKQLRKDYLEGYLSSLKAEVAGGSGWEEIIMTIDKNVGLALQEQSFKWNQELAHYLGAVGPNASPMDRDPVRLWSEQWAALARPQIEVQKDQLTELRTIRQQGEPRRKARSGGGESLSELLRRAAKAAEVIEATTCDVSQFADSNVAGNAPA